MRIVFMGTPTFAVPSLIQLAAAHDVVLVVTRPDAVRARGKVSEPSPVKAAARELGVPVLETRRMNASAIDTLRQTSADVFCVAAFGCILPDEVLGIPPLGCVNVHASLLPRWRGAAPIQRAILSGDTTTGVSIMRMGHGVDTGAFCAQASCSVTGKSAEELTSELAEMGASLLRETLPKLAQGTLTWTAQDEKGITHAPKIDKRELMLSPHLSAHENELHVLASSASAPARCVLAGKSARIHAARESAEQPLLAPGACYIEHGRVFLGCMEGALEMFRVTPEGKREMDARAWAAGQHTPELSWEPLA